LLITVGYAVLAFDMVGLPIERFTGVPIGEVDEATRALVAPLVERAGLVAAFNDAWLLLGGLVLLSMLVLLVRAPARSGSSA
jgi:MFS transporter, DHA2 family, multidrug resistance protein